MLAQARSSRASKHSLVVRRPALDATPCRHAHLLSLATRPVAVYATGTQQLASGRSPNKGPIRLTADSSAWTARRAPPRPPPGPRHLASPQRKITYTHACLDAGVPNRQQTLIRGSYNPITSNLNPHAPGRAHGCMYDTTPHRTHGKPPSRRLSLPGLLTPASPNTHRAPPPYIATAAIHRPSALERDRSPPGWRVAGSIGGSIPDRR